MLGVRLYVVGAERTRLLVVGSQPPTVGSSRPASGSDTLGQPVAGGGVTDPRILVPPVTQVSIVSITPFEVTSRACESSELIRTAQPSAIMVPFSTKNALSPLGSSARIHTALTLPATDVVS